jgi:hypothetical protein
MLVDFSLQIILLFRYVIHFIRVINLSSKWFFILLLYNISFKNDNVTYNQRFYAFVLSLSVSVVTPEVVETASEADG